MCVLVGVSVSKKTQEEFDFIKECGFLSFYVWTGIPKYSNKKANFYLYLPIIYKKENRTKFLKDPFLYIFLST